MVYSIRKIYHYPIDLAYAFNFVFDENLSNENLYDSLKQTYFVCQLTNRYINIHFHNSF